MVRLQASSTPASSTSSLSSTSETPQNQQQQQQQQQLQTQVPQTQIQQQQPSPPHPHQQHLLTPPQHIHHPMHLPPHENGHNHPNIYMTPPYPPEFYPGEHSYFIPHHEFGPTGCPTHSHMCPIHEYGKTKIEQKGV